MKTCSKCREEKDEDQFSFKNKATGLFQTYCKPCKRLLSKEHYQANKSDYIERNTKRRTVVRNSVQALIRQHKAKPCTDCGVSYPYYVMDFDHLKDKSFNVSAAPHAGIAFETVKTEIEKCEVVCANCHRARTFDRQRQLRSTPI